MHKNSYAISSSEKKSIRKIGKNLPTSSVHLMPNEIGPYYGERQKVMIEKDKRDTEKHLMNIRKMKLGFMLKLVDSGQTETLDDAKRLVGSGIFG